MDITLKELITKLNEVPKRHKIDTEAQRIIDVWVAGDNDRDYPSGTIVFECVEKNVNERSPTEHRLYICPDQISRLN